MHEQRPKTAKGKPISNFRQPRGQQNGQTDRPIRSDNLLFVGGDEEVRLVADKDDEARTTDPCKSK